MEHGAHHAGIGDLLFPLINFAIFAFVVVRFAGGPIREFFRARTERLRDALAVGARAREESTAAHTRCLVTGAALKTPRPPGLRGSRRG